MHLVFVTSIVPDGTLTSGYEIANAAILAGLRRAGIKVSILGFTWPGRTPLEPEATAVLGAVDVQTETASRLQRVKWLTRALIERQTFSSVKLRGPGVKGIKVALSTLEPYDGYVLNGVQLAGAYPDLFGDRPSIFVAHNVEHQSAAENAAAATSMIPRLLFRREAKLLRGLEKHLCERAGFVFTLAEEDRAALGVADDRRSATLPLTTRPVAPLGESSRTIDCDAAMIGTWTWAPNRIGLEWFLQEVTPHLPASMRIHIAGRVPADIQPRHPGVRFVGRVEDATAFIRSGGIIPLISRAGTGVQLKTIETFELGLPAVATTSALRGIDHIPDNCVVADDAQAFAQAMETATRQPPHDADGSGFHAAQLRAMDARIQQGLSQFSTAGRSTLP